MACIQACGTAQAFHGKHKAAVNQMCDMTHGVVNKHCHDQGAMTAGCIKNNAEGNCIKFYKSHDWSGHVKGSYPQHIDRCHIGNFVHAARCHGQADEAAVVYSDECGSGWLLAWSVKDHCGGRNKVYAETGPIEKYRCINWCEVKAKLDASCDNSYNMDECHENEVYAKISNGNKSALVAYFNSFSC